MWRLVLHIISSRTNHFSPGKTRLVTAMLPKKGNHIIKNVSQVDMKEQPLKPKFVQINYQVTAIYQYYFVTTV